MKYLQYDENGKILFHCEVPDSMMSLQTGNIFIGEADPNVSYILDGEAVNREASIVTLDSTNTLQNIPEGATVWINDKAYPATATTCQLEFSYPGTYTVRVESFPYLDFITEITQ